MLGIKYISISELDYDTIAYIESTHNHDDWTIKKIKGFDSDLLLVKDHEGGVMIKNINCFDENKIYISKEDL